MTAYPTLAVEARPESLPGVNISRLLERPTAQNQDVLAVVETPAQSGPRPIPPAQLAHLRSLRAAYHAALDTTLIGMGFENGGCRVDLVRGLVAPPEGK